MGWGATMQERENKQKDKEILTGSESEGESGKNESENESQKTIDRELNEGLRSKKITSLFLRQQPFSISLEDLKVFNLIQEPGTKLIEQWGKRCTLEAISAAGGMKKRFSDYGLILSHESEGKNDIEKIIAFFTKFIRDEDKEYFSFVLNNKAKWFVKTMRHRFSKKEIKEIAKFKSRLFKVAS